MSATAKLSVVIPWADRPELAETLRKNVRYISNKIEIIIVNFGGSVCDISNILREPLGVPILLVQVEAERFNKSAALNIGILHSSSPVILTLDADIVLLNGDLLEMACHLEMGSAFTVSKVFESCADTDTKEIAPSGNLKKISQTIGIETALGAASIKIGEISPTDGARLGVGLLCCHREDLIAVGGYNSDLAGWGWEDVDILIRLEIMRKLRLEQKGECMHLTHGDELRSSKDGSKLQSESNNRAICLKAYDEKRLTGSLQRDAELHFIRA